MSASAYLDYNAGGPVRPVVAEAMAAALAEGGNPSSVHAAGRRARARVEAAREAVAALVGADPAGLVFTSGGSEANLLALSGCGRPRVLVSAVEHASVRGAVPEAEVIPVEGDGIVDLAALEALLAGDGRSAVVSVMLANNETGVIQPVAQVADIAHRAGALVHCDAAQAVGRLNVSMSHLCVDFLTMSAHKMGGPSGIGALALADVDFSLAPNLRGGGQERGRRAGTENLAGIVGFAAAAQARDEMEQGETTRLLALRDGLEAAAMARVPAAVVVAKGAERLPNTSCLALPGVSAQVQVMALDLAGVMVGAGAACSSGKVTASPVLTAMGLGADVVASAVRVSLGWASTGRDVERFLAAWTALAARKGFHVAAEAA